MILRRITQHVKEQNWFAVALDFGIVVLGVFIGLQVSNWNDSRANREGAVNALIRLQDEVRINVAAADEVIKRLEDGEPIRSAAIQAVSTCDASEDALADMSEAIELMLTDIVPSFTSNTLDEIGRQDAYLKLYSDSFRTALGVYDGHLNDEAEQLKINFNLMWDQHISANPHVGMNIGEEGVSEASFSFSEPMQVLCADNVFVRQFGQTEGWHQSTSRRLNRFKERSMVFLDALDQELAAQQ